MFLFGNRQANTRGELADRLRKGDLLEQLDKLDDVPPNAATETVKHAAVTIDMERRRFFPVKGTQAFPLRAASLERHAFLDDLDDVRVGLQVIDEACWK